MYYVVSFEGRCMGFCPTEQKAQDIVGVLGEGSRVDRENGPFPTDESVAAAAWERKQTVRTLRPEEIVTLELSADDLAQLRAATAEQDACLDEDPWGEPENTLVVPAPGQSGFFTPAAVG